MHTYFASIACVDFTGGKVTAQNTTFFLSGAKLTQSQYEEKAIKYAQNHFPDGYISISGVLVDTTGGSAREVWAHSFKVER